MCEDINMHACVSVYLSTHVQVKHKKGFEEWLAHLRHHRLYRQHEIAYGTKETPRLTEVSSPTEDIPLPPLASKCSIF